MKTMSRTDCLLFGHIPCFALFRSMPHLLPTLAQIMSLLLPLPAEAHTFFLFSLYYMLASMNYFKFPDSSRVSESSLYLCEYADCFAFRSHLTYCFFSIFVVVLFYYFLWAMCVQVSVGGRRWPWTSWVKPSPPREHSVFFFNTEPFLLPFFLFH